MRANVGGPGPHGLEALCGPPPAGGHAGHRLRFGRGVAGVERLEAELAGVGYAPHRHDTYAIGRTLHGVQTFRYRGELRHCLPGEWHVLHPDEIHDGTPGTDEGFGYRIVYLDPALVQDAVGGLPLPFVADPVLRARQVAPAVLACLDDIDDPLEELAAVEIVAVLADLLFAHARTRRPRRSGLDIDAMRRVRDFLIDDVTTRHAVAELEQVANLDRWTIARQFRAAFGTSPTRFRTMRQLDVARRLMRTGHALSEVAAAVGFADQSHLTRMFKRTYGLTPAAWLAAVQRESRGRRRAESSGMLTRRGSGPRVSARNACSR